MSVRHKHIRVVVEQLLATHEIRNAPVKVDAIARRMGLLVRSEPAEDGLCGFLLRDRQSGRAIIGVNSTHHPNRRRFTLAHELAHFMLHDLGRIHIDREIRGYQVRCRDGNSSKGTDETEVEANLFAAELLMPVAFLERDLAEVEGGDLLDEKVLKPLARKYIVSSQALTFRLSNLGYVQL